MKRIIKLVLQLQSAKWNGQIAKQVQTYVVFSQKPQYFVRQKIQSHLYCNFHTNLIPWNDTCDRPHHYSSEWSNSNYFKWYIPAHLANSLSLAALFSASQSMFVRLKISRRDNFTSEIRFIWELQSICFSVITYDPCELQNYQVLCVLCPGWMWMGGA